jgi:hypothetical protein
MRRITLSIIAAAVLAAVPATASAQSSGQTIPVPDPIVTKLGHTPMVELWDGGGGLPYLGVSHPYNAGDWQDSLREYYDSGVYMDQLTKVDAVAERFLRWADRGGRRGHFKLKVRHGHTARVAVRGFRHKRGGHKHGNGHGHAYGHHKKLAIVFDIDETVLSNYEKAIEPDNFVFGPLSQAETTLELGLAIKPSLDLYNAAKARGITPFFITGRGESADNRSHTESNLHREGFSDWKQLYLKPSGFTGTTVDYKSGARADIEDQGYRIVASVGDQYSDLAGGHEDVAFKLPNPFYFLP